jgi:hypothetical protein
MEGGMTHYECGIVLTSTGFRARNPEKRQKSVFHSKEKEVKPMTKSNHSIVVKAYLNEEENEKLRELSRITRLSKSKVIRLLITMTKLKEAPSVDYPKFIRELRAIGNNLNQLLLVARTRGWSNQKEISSVLSSVIETENRIVNEFTSGKDEVPWR